MTKNDLVSIIITTKNEQSVIEALLKSAKRQSYSPIEIILVDNSSKDNTQEIAKKHTHHVFTKGPERSTQRNFGAQKARGKYLLFLDADMKMQERVVEEAVKVMEDPTIGAVIIPEESFGKTFWAKVKAYERSFYIGDDAVEAARFFRKDVFEKLDGFDETITGPEDWELSDRVRSFHRIGRTMHRILHDEGELTLGMLVKKKYYYGLKTPQYLRKSKQGTSFSPKTLFFLRSSFYTHPSEIISHPVLFCAMILMLFVELAAGIAGVIVGSLHD